MKNIVHHIGVDLDPHVIRTGIGHAANIANRYCRSSEQHDLVPEGLRRHGAVDDIDHRILLVSLIWSREVYDGAAIALRLEFVGSNFDALQALSSHVGDAVLIFDVLRLANRLQRQRGKKI